MSILITNTSINYGNTSTIIISDLINITITPSDSVISLEQSNNNSYIAIVKPIISTIYYVSGYNAFQEKLTFNGTVYVKTTVLNLNENSSVTSSEILLSYKDVNQSILTVNVDYNYPIVLNAYGVNSYEWFPSTYLNQTNGSSVVCTPLKNIRYTIIGKDIFNTITRAYINVVINSGLQFSPSSDITIYDGNLLNISVQFEGDDGINYGSNDSSYYIFDAETLSVQTINSDTTYTWKSNLFNGLPPSCTNLLYGSSISLHPYKSVQYTVAAYNNNQILTEGIVNINVTPKPSNIIDVDIIPYKIYQIVLNRNKKELLKELTSDTILSKKIINFYYNTLQTAYRMEWTNKNGIPFVVKWYTLYQNLNNSNEMILSFEQQWNFFKYINNNQTRNNQVRSNFAFLLNCVNQIYLEHPQQIYYIQQ